MVDFVEAGKGVSREDVLMAYEMFLGRSPESDAVVDWHMQYPTRRLLAEHMLNSAEFGLQRSKQTIPTDQYYPGYVEPELAVLAKFEAYTGPGSPGFVTNFLGVKIRISFSTPLKPFDGYVEGYPQPIGGVQAETAEFIGTLRSVLDANDRYTLLECGAGYGPWMAITAAAAKQRGISDLRLYGIEGDAGHFEFLSEHLTDNGIDPADHHLIYGAIGSENGVAHWALVEDPADVYGGRPIDGELIDYHGRRQAHHTEVKVYSINEILGREPVWDLVHVDIQGGEAEVCRAGIDMLTQRVRRVMIGTHSRALDGQIMSIFHEAGWFLENEKPTIMAWRDGAPTLETMARVDGLQVWRNPALIGPPSL